MAAHDNEEYGRDELLWRLERLEGRRSHADSFAWAVPGLALASQAFLLQIALAPATSSLGRLLASLAGIVALLASAHLFAKSSYNFDLYEAVIERDRTRIDPKLPGLQTDALTSDVAHFPENTSYVRRKWGDKRLFRHGFVVDLKAFEVWGAALGILLAIDLFVFCYALPAIAGIDYGWLDKDVRHLARPWTGSEASADSASHRPEEYPTRGSDRYVVFPVNVRIVAAAK